MSLTLKALWIIERNLTRDLSLDEIARGCGVSKYHLSHAFGQTTGCSVMQYLRERRLAEAARRLADGAANILALAIGSGYGSHEAFSRSFKQHFGATPEVVRARGSTADLKLRPPARVEPSTRVPLRAPRFVDGDSFDVIGLAGRHNVAGIEGIPHQWERFMRDFAGQIDGERGGLPLAITADMDDEGNFTYVAGIEVASAHSVPVELTRTRIERHRWAIFEHAGHIALLKLTYASIFDDWLQSHELVFAGTPVLERPKPTFDPRTGNGGTELWIPIAV